MDLSIEVIVTGTSVELILSWHLAAINIVKQMLSPRSNWRERMFWLSQMRARRGGKYASYAWRILKCRFSDWCRRARLRLRTARNVGIDVASCYQQHCSFSVIEMDGFCAQEPRSYRERVY